MEEKHPLTEVEVEAEAIRIADGKMYDEFQGRPIVIRSPSLTESNRLSQIYAKEVARLTMEGELLNESMVDALVRQRAKAMGVDLKALDPRVQQAWFRKLFESVPEMFDGSGNTDVILKKSEEMASCMSEDDMEMLSAVNSVLGLKTELSKNTVEVQARSIQLKWELFLMSSNLDGTSFWGSIEEMESCPDKDFEKLVQRYQNHKRGGGLDFLSNSLPTQPGKESGSVRGGKQRTSSKTTSSRGRVNRKH